MAQDTLHDPAHGLTLTKRFNALMAERDERMAAAGGWLTATDPAWRTAWRARMDQLVAEVAEYQGARP